MSAHPSTPTDGGPDGKPVDWPRGADEDLVRECNCDHCQDLIERLDDDSNEAWDGQPSLSAFEEGQQ